MRISADRPGVKQAPRKVLQQTHWLLSAKILNLSEREEDKEGSESVRERRIRL
jgi:hypothetical protein